MTTAALIATIIAGLSVVGTGAGYLYSNSNVDKAERALKAYNSAIKGSNLEGYSLKDVFGMAYSIGVIDEASYKNTLYSLEQYSEKELSSANINNWASLFKNDKRLAAAVEDMTQRLPELNNALSRLDKLGPEDIRDAVQANAVNVPAPSYFSSNLPDGERFEVHDPRLLSGQEMADLHGINYDPAYYYDLIKQGTSANVELGHFTADQQRAASNWSDQATIADYLTSIQDAKSSAIANGATSGARAAAEVLASRQNAQSKLGVGMAAAQNRFDTVDDYLRADANARLTTREYFDSLAQHLSTDAASYYTNDVEDYVGDITANANMAAGDWNLWGQRQTANGMMAGAYAQNKAVADAANAVGNEFFDVYGAFYNDYMNKGVKNPGTRAFLDTQNYIAWSNNNNFTNYYDVYQQRTKNNYDPLGYFAFNSEYNKNNLASNYVTK